MCSYIICKLYSQLHCFCFIPRGFKVAILKHLLEQIYLLSLYEYCSRWRTVTHGRRISFPELTLLFIVPARTRMKRVNRIWLIIHKVSLPQSVSEACRGSRISFWQPQSLFGLVEDIRLHVRFVRFVYRKAYKRLVKVRRVCFVYRKAYRLGFDFRKACWWPAEVRRVRFDDRKARWRLLAIRRVRFVYRKACWRLVEVREFVLSTAKRMEGL